MMLMGIHGDGTFCYTRMMRQLGFNELTGEIPERFLKEASGESCKEPSSARAAQSSGDIIAHRDEEVYDQPTIDIQKTQKVQRAKPVAATCSGDIIGHSSPIRSADLDWSLKGRVIDKRTGTVLDYANPDGNMLLENPGQFGAYRNSGDIIANSDFRYETERNMFQSKRQARGADRGLANNIY